MEFGPPQYHSPAQYEKLTGHALPRTILGDTATSSSTSTTDRRGLIGQPPSHIETDPKAQANYFAPRQRTIEMYLETMTKHHLDGYVYPAIQMPPPDETMPQNGGISEGPHSETSWVNMIGVPAVVVVGGFYPSGLPFGLEISAKPWHDGDLLGWAYDYEQHTRYRHPPVLVEHGLLPDAK